MTLEQLKKITVGDQTKFKKKADGYKGWSFQEVVIYKGYDDAVKTAKQYTGNAKNCKLVKTYKAITEIGDSYLIEAKTTEQKKIIFLTTLDGWILIGELAGSNYKEWEQENKGKLIKRNFTKVFKKDYENKLS